MSQFAEKTGRPHNNLPMASSGSFYSGWGTQQPMSFVGPADAAVLLFGKAGHGKSSLGNLLTNNPNNFPTSLGLASVTSTANVINAEMWGKKVKVIDTPDLTLIATEKDRQQELDQWNKQTDKLPVVIILVIRSDTRLSSPDVAAYHHFLQQLKYHSLVVVFTFSDRHQLDLRQAVADVPGLGHLLKGAKDKIIHINTATGSAGENRESAQRLMDLIRNEFPDSHAKPRQTPHQRR